MGRVTIFYLAAPERLHHPRAGILPEPEQLEGARNDSADRRACSFARTDRATLGCLGPEVSDLSGAGLASPREIVHACSCRIHPPGFVASRSTNLYVVIERPSLSTCSWHGSQPRRR